MLRILTLLLLLAASLFPIAAFAQSPFDGTWKIDVNTAQISQKPTGLLVQDGIYQCTTCTPPLKIAADGNDHPVTGDPYYDHRAIQVLSDHSIQTADKKDGKIVRTQKLTVSPDGNTLTVEFSNSTNTSGAPVVGKGTLTRVAPGPTGSNAISGSWKAATLGNRSDNNITWTYKVIGDQLAMSLPTGQSFTAKLNGPQAPFHGDPGITTVAVKTIGTDTLQEINMRDDKVYFLFTMTLQPGGKSATVIREDKLRGATERYIAFKQ